ncbi:IS5 family transposase [Martelella soudanensis]|uniref:IS5 family transposase n=1 Tax=unclassified Martelella TaxID=2629616 RepID=UPI00353010E4
MQLKWFDEGMEAMWTKANRGKYNRDGLRYSSDITDVEWALVEPLIPPAKRGGRRREVDAREVINGLLYVLSTGCRWRAVPKDLPPKSTLFSYFDLWNRDGTLGRIHRELYVKCRGAMAREATAAIIDSQSVKGAEKGGVASTHAGMMRGRRSKARSAISSSIR